MPQETKDSPRWTDLFGIDPTYTGGLCASCFVAWNRDEPDDMCDDCYDLKHGTSA